MGNITYQQELYSDIALEIQPLLVQHYEEVAMYKDKVPLAPDWKRYKDMEERGILHVVTVRDDGVLVGYYVTMIVEGLHYRFTKYGVNDIVLIKPEYRNAGVGLGLFRKVEALLKEVGVEVMTVHMKTYIPFDSLCEGLGFDYAERLYTKYIGE